MGEIPTGESIVTPSDGLQSATETLLSPPD